MPDHVAAPDGTEWVVGRRWLPRRPRWVGKGRPEGTKSEWLEGIGNSAHLGDLAGGADDAVGGAAAVVGIVAIVVVVAVLAFVFVVPAVIFVIDLLLVLVLAAIAIVARVLFRRPWIVIANTDDHTHEWAVVGWKASGAAIKIVKRAIVRGESLDDVRLRLL